MRGGGVVWDATTTHRTQADAAGKFRFDAIDGGSGITVSPPGYAKVETSLCSLSPMTIWLGGAFDGADFGKNLMLGAGTNEIRMGWRFSGAGQRAPESSSDLVAVRTSSDGTSVTSLRAPLGIAFRAGTGNPPQAPQSGYAPDRTLDLLRDCGWLFVRTRDVGTVPVRIGSYGLDQPLEGGRYLTLSYAALRQH